MDNLYNSSKEKKNTTPQEINQTIYLTSEGDYPSKKLLLLKQTPKIFFSVNNPETVNFGKTQSK